MADPWHECIGYAVTLARQDGEVVHEAVRNEINAMIKSSPVDLVTATGFPGDSNGSLPANSGDPTLITGLGRCPGGGNDNLPPHSCLEYPMDRGA